VAGLYDRSISSISKFFDAVVKDDANILKNWENMVQGLFLYETYSMVNVSVVLDATSNLKSLMRHPS
jgi:hypothetical protein